MIIVSHPTGNQFVRFLLHELILNNDLYMYITGIGFSNKNNVINLFSSIIDNNIARRSYNISQLKIKSYPAKGLHQIICGRLSKLLSIECLAGIVTQDDIYRELDKNCSKFLKNLDYTTVLPHSIYAYEDGAEASFRTAREKGLYCIYDLPIAYWETSERLQSEEAYRLPRWAGTLGDGRSFPERKRLRKTSELDMADLVICPSDFVKHSLPDWASGRNIRVIPFGSPQQPSSEEIAEDQDSRCRRFEQGKPLRVLFCGSMGQRKGLGDLFQAMNLLDPKKVELVVLGSPLAPIDFYREEYPNFVHELGRPHGDILKLMRTCDVFCLPSIVEGRALVMQEAMSQGLPLIITPNTGGEDLIREGETGFLVPIRSPQRIAERIQWCMDHRDRLPAMSRAAAAHASTFTWENYAQQVAQAIRDLCRE